MHTYIHTCIYIYIYIYIEYIYIYIYIYRIYVSTSSRPPPPSSGDEHGRHSRNQKRERATHFISLLNEPQLPPVTPLRQYVYLCTSFCVSMCTFVPASAPALALFYYLNPLRDLTAFWLILSPSPPPCSTAPLSSLSLISASPV
jgi:hypothetical protein